MSRAWLGWCTGGVLLVAGVLGVGVDPVFAAEAPVVEGVSSGEETATTAELQGQVNPEESPTSCVFEYGTSTSYGHSVACQPASVGSGTSSVAVSARLEGLEANVTYHWRLAATNGIGTSTSTDQTFVYLTGTGSPPGSCPDEQARTERHSLGLPDCRAYMMVTPSEKNGAIIGNPAFGPGVPQISENGQRVIARSIQCFGEAQSCIANRGKREGSLFEFERTPGGWITHPLAPSANELETSTTFVVNANDGTAVFGAPVHTTIPTGFSGEQEVLYGRMEDGELVRIGPLEEEGHHIGSYRALTLEAPVIATADLSHVLYFATTPLWGFDPTDGGSGEAHTLYEYCESEACKREGVSSGAPLLVGVRGAYGSDQPVSFCATEYDVEGIKPGGTSLVDPMSESGRTVFFTAEGQRENGNCTTTAPAADQVWARVDGETPGAAHSVLLSGPAAGSGCRCEGCTSSECVEHTSAADEGMFARNANFEGASSDGGVAVFSSEQQLTNDAGEGEGENLYESVCAEPCGSTGEEPQARGRRLIDVSETAGHEPVAGGPRVQGVEALSADGSHVYFVAQGVLTGSDRIAGRSPEVQAPTEGENNLYVFERDESHPEGHVSFVATLSPADEEVNWKKDTSEVPNVTPDGRFLVFMSHKALTADDTRGEGPTQVYEYDAQTQSLVRVSVGEDGYNDDGNDGVGGASIVSKGVPMNSGTVPVRSDPTMSDDGGFVFFRSPVALTPGALNDVPIEGGEAQNFYEYHEGQVFLVSDGKDTAGNGKTSESGSSLKAFSTSNLLGADVSGADVFFSTFDQLVPEDTDTELDYYDAQVCGESEPFRCLPPLVEPISCGEGNCQGPAAAGAGAGLPASATFSGAGNLPAPGPEKAVVVLSRAQKLAKALKACRVKKNKRKRLACETSARKRYGPVHKAKKKHKAKKSGSRPVSRGSSGVGVSQRGGE